MLQGGKHRRGSVSGWQGSFLAVKPLGPPRHQCVWFFNTPAGKWAPFLVSAKVGEARPQNLPRPGPQAGQRKGLVYSRSCVPRRPPSQRHSILIPDEKPCEKT